MKVAIAQGFISVFFESIEPRMDRIPQAARRCLSGQHCDRYDPRQSFTFTPKYGSWLNLIEGFFSKLACSAFHIRAVSKRELRDRIMAAMDSRGSFGTVPPGGGEFSERDSGGYRKEAFMALVRSDQGTHRKWPWRGLSRRSASDSLLRLGAVFACAGLAFQSAEAQETPDYPKCVSQLWAAGTQLGRAEAIARHDTTDDAVMLDDMLDAGLRVEQANALCARNPAPWPAWPNWRETQDQLATMTEKFRNGQVNRQQLAIGLAALHQGLASQLAFRVLPTHIERDATCVEIYMRLGVTLGYAQMATRISGRIMPDAVERLRKTISLIYQTREMPSRCLDFKGLIPSIQAALKTPNDSLIAGQLDEIVHAADLVATPRIE